MQARLPAKTKSERGICNDVTGHLLCPIEFDWDDPEYVVTWGTSSSLWPNLNCLFSIRAKLRKGDEGYDFSSSFFLRCLYEDEEGDDLCPQEGFLKGPLLLRVSFSPSGPSVFDIHFDFRLTATSSHHLPLPTMKTQLLKSPLGDAMLPLHSAWVAMSLGDQSHMPQPKFVNLFFSDVPFLTRSAKACFRTVQCS